MTSSFKIKENSHSRHCPMCGRNQVYVVESRSTYMQGNNEPVRRRRLECAHCGHRNTTKEVRTEYLSFLIDCMRKVERIKELTISASNDAPSGTKSLCRTCNFNDNDRCNYELPEFRTEESSDCSLYQNRNHSKQLLSLTHDTSRIAS